MQNGDVSSTQPEAPRRFRLIRRDDVTGVSGTGAVAEGAEWTSGWVALHWPGKGKPGVTSTAVYESVEKMMKVHGHDGATVIEWIDQAGVEWTVRETAECAS